MRLLMVVLFVAVLGCGEDRETPVSVDSPAPRATTRAEADARAELADRGIPFTGASFLEWAGADDLEVVELFVEAGMSVDTTFGGWTALHEAARNGHLSVVEYLVDQGASLVAETECGNTVLDLAAQGGHTDIVEYIPRSARAALERRGFSYTPDAFRDAAGSGNLEVVKLFVEVGMDVNARNLGWRTALHEAAWWGHLSVVEYLVSQGADVRARDNGGVTVLHSASGHHGRLSVVRYLVEQGLDVNATSSHGTTPLMWAAAMDRLEVVQYLVGQGADVRATDNEGRTAQDWATISSAPAVAAYLESVGG